MVDYVLDVSKKYFYKGLDAGIYWAIQDRVFTLLLAGKLIRGTLNKIYRISILVPGEFSH